MSRASGEGSWKIGRESIGRYFFGLNAEMEAIRVFKDESDPPSSFVSLFRFHRSAHLFHHLA